MKLNLVGEVYDYEDLVKAINSAEEDIELVVNSPGGDVFCGLQIVNAIQQCQHRVTARVEVMSASIAAVITLACDNFTISKNDLMLLHNCWTWTVGNKEELRQEAETMEKIDAVLHNIITEHCSDPDAVNEKMDSGDYWLTGEEAANLFDNCQLVDRAVEKGKKAAFMVNMADLLNKQRNLEAMLDKQTELVRLLQDHDSKLLKECEEKQASIKRLREEYDSMHSALSSDLESMDAKISELKIQLNNYALKELLAYDE